MRRSVKASLLAGLVLATTLGSAVVAHGAAAAVSAARPVAEPSATEPSATEPSATEPPVANWRLERDGVELQLELAAADETAELRLAETEHVLFRLAITDTATGQPLGGLYPALWMARLAPGEELDQARCNERVQEYVGGSILARPELDLKTLLERR